MIINDKRALAYTTRVGEISKIEGADNIELISVLGWRLLLRLESSTKVIFAFILK